MSSLSGRQNAYKSIVKKEPMSPDSTVTSLPKRQLPVTPPMSQRGGLFGTTPAAGDGLMKLEQDMLPTLNGAAEYSMEYLAELLKEKKQLAFFPSLFHHIERLIDEEIARVRLVLFQCDFFHLEGDLPEPQGEVKVLSDKVYIPSEKYPDYNFVGRILGPRGMTAKQLEQETGCKIMVRGSGSMRDRRKEESNRGKPKWEHLEDKLHVLIHCEDTENRARPKLEHAVKVISSLLVPTAEGTDELKRKQLMELAIINGTYRPAVNTKLQQHQPRLLGPVALLPAVRHGGHGNSHGAPIFVTPANSPQLNQSAHLVHHHSSPNGAHQPTSLMEYQHLLYSQMALLDPLSMGTLTTSMANNEAHYAAAAQMLSNGPPHFYTTADRTHAAAH